MAIFTPVSITCGNCGCKEEVSETEMREQRETGVAKTECRFCQRMGERSLVRIIRQFAA